jgi:hypothetical protein
MHRSARILTVALCSCLVTWSTAFAETLPGTVGGEVVDASDAVLPGVTVTATTENGKALATTTTDATGHFELSVPAAGSMRLEFRLDGFEPAVADIGFPSGSSLQLGQRLELARLTESVSVVAKAPADLPVRVPPVPPPVIVPVPSHDRDSICGPAKPSSSPESFGTIKLRRHAITGNLYAMGDQLVIEGATRQGLAVGQNFVVRRLYRVTGADGRPTTGEHSSGLVQIVATEDDTSTALVVYACDEMMKGDFLASFAPEPVRNPEPDGAPAYESAARILFPDAGAIQGTARRLMVIDRGRANDVHPGQRLTLFRRHRSDTAKTDVVGEAVVVAVRANSATIRVERATEGISAGDWAAPQRPASDVTSASVRGSSPRF